MNDNQLLPVDAVLPYTVDFTNALPSAVAISACVWSATPALSLSGQTDDFAANQSTIRAGGAAHGVTYRLQATATASNGEVYVKDIAVQGVNG